MAIRVRKLAKELRRPPEHLLGVLHALGYRRYRSPDDMIGDDVRARLARALRSGVAPVPVEEETRSTQDGPSELERLAQGDGSIMGSLMRGVEPMGHAVSGRPKAEAAPSPTTARPTPVALSRRAPSDAALSDRAALLDSRERTLELEKARLEDARRQVEGERERVEALRMSVAQDREELAERRRTLDALRAALDEERAVLLDQQRDRAASASASLVSLLEARGLRGVDEFERAIVALARVRRLQDVLLTLGTDEPRTVRRLLAEHLLLTGPQPPSALEERNEAVVCVAPERAEVPDEPVLRRLGERLSDAMLLAGHRQLHLVGGRPAIVRQLQQVVDERVVLSWAPGPTRTVAAAQQDVSRADVVVLWGIDEEPEARALYDAARPVVVRVEEGRLQDLVAAVSRA